MKKLFYKISIAVVSLLLVSCTATSYQKGDSDGIISITHPMGVTQVKKNPKRPVIFDIGALDTFSKLELRVAGAPVNDLPQYLKHYKEDKTIIDVGSVKEANYEKVSALNSELIIISGRLQTSYDEMTKIAPTIYTNKDYHNYMPTFREDVRNIGQLYGMEDEVESELKKIDEKIEKVKAKIAAQDQKALIVLFNNGRMSSYGKGSRFGFIHDVLGVKTAIDEIEVSTHGQVISSEMVESTNPDILFIVDRGAIVNGKGASKDEVENELIRQTNAYKNGKIIYLNPEIWYLSGGGLISVDMMIDEIDRLF